MKNIAYPDGILLIMIKMIATTIMVISSSSS